MRSLALAAAFLMVAATAAPALGVAFGQTDPFSGGSLMDWGGGTGGGGPSPVNVATGGPAGAGDGYLLIETDGFHLGTRNNVQWAGDYAASGVTRIEVDLRSFGPDDVEMRLLLFGPGGGWATTDMAPVPTGGAWTHYVFDVAAADLVYVADSGGSGTVAETLSGVTQLLLRNDTTIPTAVGQHPPHITAQVGIDNLQAAPEPGTLLLCLGGLATLLARRGRSDLR